MHAFSNNPGVTPSPFIDVRTILNLNEITESGKRWLWVKGICMTKGYPAFELFIEDPSGIRVFLYVQAPIGEHKLAEELIPPRFDRRRVINFKMEINSSGNFVYPNGVVRVAELSASTPLVNAPFTFIPCLSIGFGQVPAFSTFSAGISYMSWNNDFFSLDLSQDYNTPGHEGDLGSEGSPPECE